MSAGELTPAAPVWRNGQPFSPQFRDPYFSITDGRAETTHVFLHHNRLALRWRALPARASFCIGETGFGAGLNFLCAAQLWLRSAHRDTRLHFVSAEQFPLPPDVLARALAPWPDLRGLADRLLAVYPPLVPGWHRVHIGGGRVILTLLFGDATTAFRQLGYSNHPGFELAGPSVDAWFLDGFAPARNPELWTPELFALLAARSRPGTTFSTYTAAGGVRRGLTAAGFDVTKVAGFAGKRDMLCGEWRASPDAAPAAQALRPRGATPWHLPATARCNRQRRAVVVGGGIAGCTAAAALAERGWKVTLCERRGTLAAEASGNPQAILYPRLSAQSSPLARINLAALLYASRFYLRFWEPRGRDDTVAGARCGVLVLPEQPSDVTRFQRIAERYRHAPGFVRWVTGAEVSAAAGIPLAAAGALLFPQLGWIHPATVCAALCSHPNIRVESLDVSAIAWDAQALCWTLAGSTGRSLAAPVAILANGITANRFDATDWLPLKAVRGQVSLVPATAASSRLRAVVCGAGYLAPAVTEVHSLGATYQPDDADTDVRVADHTSNLAQIAATDAALPALLGYPSSTGLAGRAALRCTAPDYLPLAGPAPQCQPFLSDYAALRRDARRTIPRAGAYWPGLYLNCGHGSRGMAYAPFVAELLASQIGGEPLPIERELAIALNPARFLIRALKRRQC